MLNLKAVCFSAMIILGGAYQHAHATEPTTDQKIETLMQGIDFDQQRHRLLDQIFNALKATNLEVPQSFMDRATAIMMENYEDVFSNQNQAIIEIYKSVYSEAEIDAMYNFYSTPVGRQILDKNSAISKEITEYSLPKSVEFIQKSMGKIQTDPEIQRIIRETRQKKQ
ncbi:DUF2059 domain-containing protein [Kaistia nematophila]|uniref:DUF2059 domain-containing protein n=1 Tax=Kaistia nematophila TaxID=2994654 RepID=A0A9X3E2E4_9HYPH|nr:DUF2059 domain-containing protein [Kaistia nematophila]MCX5570429.1 DUF2059 domain-containing protein [Kaistia nematophila]